MRITRGPFALAILAVYALSFGSQALLSGPVTASISVWPFVGGQIILTVIWIKLHQWRLRDAGRPTGMAIGIAAIYVIEIVLLVLLVWLILYATSNSSSGGGSSDGSILPFFVVLYLLVLMNGDASGLQIWMIAFSVLMLLPVAIAVVYSIWVGTRPSVPDLPPP